MGLVLCPVQLVTSTKEKHQLAKRNLIWNHNRNVGAARRSVAEAIDANKAHRIEQTLSNKSTN
jgi:hypothetical protein